MRMLVPSSARFPSERVAAGDREHPVARRRDAGFYVSRLTLGEFLPHWLRAPGLSGVGHLG